MNDEVQGSPTMIAIDQIDLTDEDRLRVNDHSDTIEDYEETYRHGMVDGVLHENPFPPCAGFTNEEGKFVPTAGRHRIIAGRNVGVKVFPCIVYPDKKSAIWHGIGDNRKNGLRNSRPDEKKMIEIALTTCGETNRAIAEHIGCSPSKVDQIARQLRKNTQLTETETKTGRNGKQYSSIKSRKPTESPSRKNRKEMETEKISEVLSQPEIDGFDQVEKPDVDEPMEKTLQLSSGNSSAMDEPRDLEWYAKGLIERFTADPNADVPTQCLRLVKDIFELMDPDQRTQFVVKLSCFLQKQGFSADDLFGVAE